MAINEELLKKFLLKCGLTGDDWDQFVDVEEGKEPDIDALSSDFKAAQREVYENDPDFIKNIKNEMRGKERGSVERVIMRELGVTAEEVKEHGLEGDYNKMMKFASKKLKKQSSEPAEKLQGQLQDANTEIQKYKDTIVPDIQSKADARVNKFFIANHLGDLISKSGELIVKPNVATTVVEKGLASKGLVSSLSEDKNTIRILTKDGLSPQNDDKTRNLTEAELIKGILEGEGLIKQSRGKEELEKPPASRRDDPPAQRFVTAGMADAMEAAKNVPTQRKGRGTEAFGKK